MWKGVWRFLQIIAVVCGVTCPAWAQREDTVVFGVLAFGGEADAHKRWDETIEALSAGIPDRRFELAPLTLDGARNALESRELHFLLTNPGHFSSLMLKHELAPLVSLLTDVPGRLKTGNRYGAVIFARASENGPRRLADLKGSRFGSVAPDAFGGWQLALHTLRRNGLEPDRDFEELRFFGFPQTAIVHAVLNGEVDAGTVRTGVLEAMTATGQLPEGSVVILNPLKVPNFELSLSTALIPEWLVAATPMAQPDLRSAVARVLLEARAVAKGSFTWQPPQSIAPVIEIQNALAAFEDDAGTPNVRRMISYFAAAILLSMLVFVWSRRRFGVATVASGEPSSESAPGQENGDLQTLSLTGREAEVLELVEIGQTTKEIARLLSISPKTVEFHRHNLMQKFDASNMADLVHRSGQWRQQT